MKNWLDEIDNLGACQDGLNFCKEYKTFKEAWNDCPYNDWMEWLLGQLGLADTKYCDHIDNVTKDAFYKKSSICLEANRVFRDAIKDVSIEHTKAQNMYADLPGEEYRRAMHPYDVKYEEIYRPAFQLEQRIRSEAYDEYTEFYANRIREYYSAEVVEKKLLEVK